MTTCISRSLLLVSIFSFLQLIRSHGALFLFLRPRGITGVMRGWGGVRDLYLEIRLRGRALDHLHNTDIHTSPSPLAHDQAKEMAEVSSEMGAGLLPPYSAPASFSV